MSRQANLLVNKRTGRGMSYGLVLEELMEATGTVPPHMSANGNVIVQGDGHGSTSLNNGTGKDGHTLTDGLHGATTSTVSGSTGNAKVNNMASVATKETTASPSRPGTATTLQ